MRLSPERRQNNEETDDVINLNIESHYPLK